MRTKFSEFSKEDILPAAVTFCMRLKKTFTRLANSKTLELRTLEFRNFAGISRISQIDSLLNIFTGTNFREINPNSQNS